MSIKNEIKGYISASGWTLTEVVNKMNENLPADNQTTVQNLSNKLTRGTIKYSEVREIAEIIGMKIEWKYLNEEDKIMLKLDQLERNIFNEFGVVVKRNKDLFSIVPFYTIEFSNEHTKLINETLHQYGWEELKISIENYTRSNSEIAPNSKIEEIRIHSSDPFRFTLQAYGNYVYSFIKLLLSK